MKINPLGFLVTAIAMITVSAAFAEEAHTEKETIQNDADTIATDNNSVPAISSSLRAVRDKKTGKLRAPNPAELRKMEEDEATARATQGTPSAAASTPVVTRHSNGMLSVELGPEYLVSLEGERNDDGTVKLSHDSESEQTTVANDKLPTE